MMTRGSTSIFHFPSALEPVREREATVPITVVSSHIRQPYIYIYIYNVYCIIWYLYQCYSNNLSWDCLDSAVGRGDG